MKFKAITLLILALAISGCTNRLSDGYQPGDLTLMALEAYQKLLKAQRIYCTATTDEQRASAVALLQRAGIDYVAEGFCGVELRFTTGG